MIYCSYINSQQFKVFYVLFFYWCFVVVVFLADEVKLFKVKRNLDAGGFRQFIRAIYPELRNNNFEFCKVNRHRVVVPLTESTPKEIRSSQVLGRSALYVRPLVSNHFFYKKISVVAILKFSVVLKLFLYFIVWNWNGHRQQRANGHGKLIMFKKKNLISVINYKLKVCKIYAVKLAWKVNTNTSAFGKRYGGKDSQVLFF